MLWQVGRLRVARRMRWGSLVAGAWLACMAGMLQAQPSGPDRGAQAIAPPPPPPGLRWIAPEARLPIELRRLAVSGEIVGRAAATRIEIELFNPNPRVLEAELQFPLQAGQSVTGFALDIDGELRPAVPVEKTRGRQVFEDVTRARVDPALLEATGGHFYKLRVYPLPAQGSRRVVLDLAEVLGGSGRARWRLPLALSRPVGRLDVSLRVAGVAPRAVSAQLGSLRLPVRAERGGTRVALATAGVRTGAELRVDLPVAAEASVATQRFDGADYFYAELPLASAALPRPRPARVALVWDASGSAAARDRNRELAVLDAWLRQLGDVEVLLQTVRHVAAPTERFTVRAGRWDDLRQRLAGLRYDGATRADALRAPADVDLALLFSDGLGNWGDDTGLPAQPVPTFALTSAAGADANALRRMADASGGAWLDLLAGEPAALAARLLQKTPRVVGLTAEGAEDLELASSQPELGRVALAGRLTAPEARVQLQIEAADGTRQTRTLQVASRPVEAGRGVAAQRWAVLRLERLASQGEAQRAALRRLGLQFGLATRETSLIVLDTAQDYARYGIEPPLALRPQWAVLRAQLEARQAADRDRHLARVAAQFAAKVQWWEKDFPKGAPPPRPQPTGSAPPAPAPAPMAVMSAAAPAAPAAAGPRIQLRPWQPDAPYARRLRAATSAAELDDIYFDERPAYAGSTAFFLDVADILLQRGEQAGALRVLSNLAEMELENRHVLRILAYRLLQAGEVQPALPLLARVLALSPDEPQSWRDLGLAQARAGQPQRAVEQLWQVVSRPWQDRFPGVEQIALAELNAIAAQARAAGTALDLSAVDPRLLRNLPLDLRAVLAWDADNTDIDLWVIDPNGEPAYYGNRLTYQGGRMSADFTGGFGPEEYSLRHAKPGTYTVRAQFYGHRQQIVAPATTLMLRLSTGFGTPVQKDQEVVLRLSGRGEQVTVGTFTVDAAATPATPAASGATAVQGTPP